MTRSFDSTGPIFNSPLGVTQNELPIGLLTNSPWVICRPLDRLDMALA